MAIRLNSKTFTRTQRKAIRALGVGQRVIRDAVGDAWFAFMTDIVNIARDRAPAGETGDLRASGIVEQPIFTKGMVIVNAGFNVVYARVRDEGTGYLPGGVIRPVRAEALFIPLRSGVHPFDRGLKWGIDFVLAKEVRQEGNRYWTGTLEDFMPQASRIVGRTAFAILKARASRG